MKYIFLTGAPGSRWSSVAKYLYSSVDINASDCNNSYTMPGASEPMHLGAYWDPGMEYGKNFDKFNEVPIIEAMMEFDLPFDTNEKPDSRHKVIKSHQFGKYLDYLCRAFPNSPIVIAYRPDDICYNWWKEAGGFDISYPSYNWYNEQMEDEIALQNKGILNFVGTHNCTLVKDTKELCKALDISETTYYNFADNDTEVYVYKKL